MLGRLIRTINIKRLSKEIEINIDALEAGLYYFVFHNSQNVSVKKVIKK